MCDLYIYIYWTQTTQSFLDIPNSAINRDQLNNGLYDALGNNNINKTAHIIVDILPSAAPNIIEKRQNRRNGTNPCLQSYLSDN